MGEAGKIGAEQLLLGTMLGMFILSLGIVIFFVVYQRRLLKQQKAHQQKEADYQQQLLRANFQSQERERNRIGKDLHDEVGVLLTTTKLYFQYLDPKTDPAKFEELKAKSFKLLEESMATVRRVSHDLRPVVLERMGLVEAIDNMASQVNASDQLKINFSHDFNKDIDEEYALNWYRIAQELVNNTMKHAQATTVNIELKASEDHLKMLYSDDGKGVSGDFQAFEGLGIQNIKSRISLMAGEVHLVNGAEKGFKIHLSSKLKPSTK
mgnify:CR=1 FL=1